jgi:hypothetical protein
MLSGKHGELSMANDNLDIVAAILTLARAPASARPADLLVKEYQEMHLLLLTAERNKRKSPPAAGMSI